MPKPASGKPSLMDSSPSPGGAASAEDNSIRMLDALEPAGRPAQGFAGQHRVRWLLAVLLLLVACGGSWSWWNQRSLAADSIDHQAQISGSTATEPAKVIASAASAASDPSPAATIISTRESSPLVPAEIAASTVLAAASAPDTTAPQSPALEASHPDSPSSKRPMPKPKSSVPSRDARVAAESNVERKRTAATANKSATASPSADPDVALLSAMLATMSGDARANSNGTPSPQTQLTIAQLVQRCNTRGVKDAIETFECKRRICEGYWGKADACPMSLSPKKN